MNCIYRKTTREEIPVLIELRIEFIKDIHPEFDNDKIKQILKGTDDYLTECVNNNSYWGYIGLADSEIVCCAGMLIYNLPPLNSEKFRTIGHVLSFFTKPEYRGKGYGSGLIEYIKESAKESNIDRLFLNATSLGYSIYKKSGFIESDNTALQLDL